MGKNHPGSLGTSDSQRGLCDSFQSQAPPVSCSFKSGIDSFVSPRGDSVPLGQEGGRKGLQPVVSRVLQSSLLGTQEERRLQTSHRSVHTQHVLGQSILQDGNSSFYSDFYQTGSLGFSGLVGCLFPCPHSPQISEIPSFLLQRSGIPVPSLAFRSRFCPSGLYQTHGSCRSFSAPSRHSSPSVLRRLAPSSGRLLAPFARSSLFLGQDPFFRSSPEPRKIRPDSISGLHVCGNEFPYKQKSGSASTSQSRRSRSPGSGLFPPSEGYSQGVPLPSRYLERSSRPGSSRPPPSSSDPVLPGGPMVSKHRQSLQSHSDRDISPAPLTVVARPRTPCRGGTSENPDGFHSADHRRQPIRLGCSPRAPGSHGIRLVESVGVQTSYQQLGDEGSKTSPAPISTPGTGSVCIAVIGQHDSGVLCQAPGRNSFQISVSGDSSSSFPVQRSEGLPSIQTHCRTAKCPGGRVVKETATSPIRVDSPSRSSQSDFLGAGKTDGRLVCNSTQPSPPSVCQPSPGSSSVGNRCAHVRLDNVGRLRLSPLHPDSSGAGEDQRQSGLSNPSGSTLVAPEVVVQRPPESSPRQPKSSASKTRSSVSKRRSSHQSGYVPTSRLASIQQALRKKRFSERASLLIAKSRRQSTNVVYEAKWRVYSNWCVRRKVNPLDPSPRRLADFLVYLFDTKNLSVSTIRGYRSTISHTLAFRQKSNVCHDPSISALMRALELERPVHRSLAPKWDLSCVLWSLTKSPYEPLDQASLQHLTWKTVFLLTLASAKRRSEIHALSVEEGHLRFNSSDGSVTLLCQPGFLAKTQLPSTAPEPFSIPSLSQHCGRDDGDRTLCPVRALKFYLQKVKPIRKNRQRLFIPLKGGGDVSAATISRWVASVVKYAYGALSDRDLSSFRVRAHEVRALSTSWAFVNHTPLSDILNAAFWRNPSTFSSFYLRSFARQRDNLFMLGPMVVAQSVVGSVH